MALGLERRAQNQPVVFRIVQQFEINPAVFGNHQPQAIRLTFAAECLLRCNVHSPAGVRVEVTQRYTSSGSQVVHSSLWATRAYEARDAYCPRLGAAPAIPREALTRGAARL